MTLHEFRKLTQYLPGDTHLARQGVDKSLSFQDARIAKADIGGFSSCTGSGNYFFENPKGSIEVLILDDE